MAKSTPFSLIPQLFYDNDFSLVTPFAGIRQIEMMSLEFFPSIYSSVVQPWKIRHQQNCGHPIPHDQDLACSGSWSSLAQGRELGSLGVESLKKLVLGEREHRIQNSGKPRQMEERSQQEAQVD